MQLFFRIRGIFTMMDIDLAPIEGCFAGREGIAGVEIFDDRASDATYVTVVLSVGEAPSIAELSAIREALLALPRVKVYVLDRTGQGAEIPLSEVEAPLLRHFGIRHGAA